MNSNIRFSLMKKTRLLMVLTIAVISITGVLIFTKASYDIIRAEYSDYCTDLASTVAHSVDVRKVKKIKSEVMSVYNGLDPSERIDSEHDNDPGYNAYLRKYSHIESMNEYRALRNSLRKMQDVSHMECIYLTWPDQETGQLIYLVDGAYEDIWHPGTLEPLYDSDFKVSGDITSGFGTLTSDDPEYGDIVATGMPVTDSFGQVVAYAGLDYSVEHLFRQQRRIIFIVFLIMLILTVIACFIATKLVKKFIVTPINTLSDASVGYYSDGGSGDTDRHRFADLDIHTGDEIEVLADSMAKMESDMNDHIKELLSTKVELSDAKQYAMKMEEDAFKDPMTGVRNKRSYEAAIANLSSDIEQHVAKFGIAVVDINDLKKINDSFGHSHGDDSIKTICKIICDVFRHSPVYRYGGDEFIIILRNHDLENIKDLIVQFRKQIEEMQKNADSKAWECVDAAIGYSEFDPESDRDTESVFERADKEMYRDKVRLKAQASEGQ